MKIGSRVRFLNQTGGGIVVGYAKKGWVTVQDEDGFEFPIPEKECVVIEENVVAKEEVNIQTKNGDKLNIALVYTKTGKEYNCILANECNYALLATYTNLLKEERKDDLSYSKAADNNAGKNYITSFAGEVLPYERKELFKFKIDDLNNLSKRVIFRAIPFKRPDKFKPASTAQHLLKPAIEQDFILDPTNLLKESMFRQNEFVKENGYIVSIINENEEVIPPLGNIKEREIKQALKEKFEGEKSLSGRENSNKQPVNKAYINGKWTALPTSGLQKEWMEYNALIKMSNSGIMEVDLHASALLDNTIGMDNTAILKYQLDKFNEAMAAVLHKRGEKIVFIHGKGDGVLRKAILNELKTKYSRCKWQDASFKEYGYGATMVTL